MTHHSSAWWLGLDELTDNDQKEMVEDPIETGSNEGYKSVDHHFHKEVLLLLLLYHKYSHIVSKLKYVRGVTQFEKIN